jgi:hypothetical protein
MNSSTLVRVTQYCHWSLASTVRTTPAPVRGKGQRSPRRGRWGKKLCHQIDSGDPLGARLSCESGLAAGGRIQCTAHLYTEWRSRERRATPLAKWQHGTVDAQAPLDLASATRGRTPHSSLLGFLSSALFTQAISERGVGAPIVAKGTPGRRGVCCRRTRRLYGSTVSGWPRHRRQAILFATPTMVG